MLHCEIVLFFIFAYKQKAPSFAEIRRMCAFDHIKWYDYSRSFLRLDRTDIDKRALAMFEKAFPGTQTFLPLFTNAAAQPLSRFHQHSAIYNEAGRARIQSTFSGVCLVFIWCLLLFGNTLSRSDLSTENGLNTDVITTCLQRQKHIKPFGRHSKTACRGFKSFCPCHSDLQKWLI